MSLTIVSVGKLKESHWLTAARDYLERLQPYEPTTIIEVADEKLGSDEALARTREAERIRKATPAQAYRIALTERGEGVTSAALARKLAHLALHGQSALVFWIGGASGLDPALETEADWRMGLSRLTLPHQVARVLLLEQLYRTHRIRAGHPYHK
ncbi:MAG: 23S rRNA (pseudouridine(1915)-N(3))-methyltransferase RlmH [Candidatus Sericytochromatia bacterium]|nr:23S rRNA (pseudouridine(1915)-N(3))-methyltransferase RlmH [Candidatus Sericytochromatia bacterium]